jgi:hypothetical protein
MTEMTSRAAKGSELTHGELDANFVRDVDIKTATYACLVTDNRTVIEGNHATVAFTVTLGDAATMAAADTGDYEVTIANIGAAAVTVARAGADTIDGTAASIVLQQYSSVTLKVNAATDGYNSVSRGLGDLTATIAELNILDGVTSTAAELNILDAATLTTAEINALDADQAATTPTVAGGDSFVMDDADVGTVKVDIDNVDTYLAQTTKTLTNKTLTTPTITLAQSASPTPTAEGDIQWDTDNDRLVVGNGSDQTIIGGTTGILIETITVAGAESTIDFESGIDSTYSMYRIILDKVTPTTDGHNMQFHVGTGGTPTYQTGTVYHGSTIGTIVLASLVGNASGEHANGIIDIWNPSDTSLFTMVSPDVSQHSTAGAPTTYNDCSDYSVTTAVTAFRFYWSSSGTFATGRFRLYGII